jgi:hypothetical protein
LNPLKLGDKQKGAMHRHSKRKNKSKQPKKKGGKEYKEIQMYGILPKRNGSKKERSNEPL